jgi:hypothetical protein
MSRPTRVLAGARGVNKTSWFWPADGAPANGVVLFFGGDSVDAADAPPDVVRLQAPAAQAAAVQTRWPQCAVVCVTPSRHEAGFACYDRFLPATTRAGDPLGTPPAGLPALSQAGSLLEAGRWPAATAGEAEAGAGAPASASPALWPPTRVVGFSKGGTIISQMLAELAAVGQARAGGDAAALAALEGAHPAALRLAASIQSLVYIDSGLNCRGSHCTDPGVAAGVARLGPPPPSLEIHGTARQWGDARRPWLADEAARCARAFEGAGVPVRKEEHPPGAVGAGLASHFRVIDVALAREGGV